MQQASCLEGGPLLWILSLYLHINQKSDDDDDDGSRSSCSKLCYPNKVLSGGFVKSYNTYKITCGNIFGREIVRSFCTAKAPHIFFLPKKLQHFHI